MNILIIEDNPIITMNLSGTLEGMGHHVCGTADTLVKGMQQCARKRPDLVMVELSLADGRTGLDLVNKLADLCIPLVIVSDETHTLPKTTWAKAVVRKPLDKNTLSKALAAVEADFEQLLAEIGVASAPRKPGTLARLLWPWHNRGSEQRFHASS